MSVRAFRHLLAFVVVVVVVVAVAEILSEIIIPINKCEKCFIHFSIKFKN